VIGKKEAEKQRLITFIHSYRYSTLFFNGFVNEIFGNLFYQTFGREDTSFDF
jgi:hypothetical protein